MGVIVIAQQARNLLSADVGNVELKNFPSIVDRQDESPVSKSIAYNNWNFQKECLHRTNMLYVNGAIFILVYLIFIS